MYTVKAYVYTRRRLGRELYCHRRHQRHRNRCRLIIVVVVVVFAIAFIISIAVVIIVVIIVVVVVVFAIAVIIITIVVSICITTLLPFYITLLLTTIKKKITTRDASLSQFIHHKSNFLTIVLL